MLTARQPELMSKDVFNKFIIADSILAWELVGEEVLKRLTGEYVVPMPDFSTRGFPCAPGMVILTKQRRKIRDILKPPYRVFSEFLWDFHPSSRSPEQESSKYYKNESVLMRTTETESDDDLKFEMHLSGMRRTRVKTIKIAFKGLHVEELKYEDVDLPGRSVSVRHLGTLSIA
ncbi:hypothetical protein FSP39_025512 [Pinctada imbricata]|uniref:Uncharacterized protein n=1 Tax=Pinctada imbricata TaxID=66713 RepID=A0AA89C075_PINIB|nr:hypothetical protein FSP39_025512 [Pinctada imbricata]